MRLLNTHSFKLEDFNNLTPPPYAILSHRWGNDEVLFQDVGHSRAKRRKGYSKLESFCLLARSRNLNYAWIDTCCIDQKSRAGINEAVNSMYRWYQRAAECYVFLVDVRCDRLGGEPSIKEFTSSVWFTRGWTLPELLAPSHVLFYNHAWQLLGTKAGLSSVLSRVTLIEDNVLTGAVPLSQCSVGQKLSWTARRTTTKVEDRAYSLLGIFNVSMETLYGEGELAFRRLQEEIIGRFDDHSLFAWSSAAMEKSVLAPSPSCFGGQNTIIQLLPKYDTTRGHYSLVSGALSIRLHLIPWTMNTYIAPLRCGYAPHGSGPSTHLAGRKYQHACLVLQQTAYDDHFIRVSVDGHDLVRMSGSEIADRCQSYGLSNHPVLIRHLDESSYIRPANPSFYGFTFSFEHPGLFQDGRVPSKSDALCLHKWDSRKHFFQIGIGEHRAAGILRLSGLSASLYMYLGFDLDFSPLCLITSRDPLSRNSGMLPPKFSKVGEGETLHFLNINWLRSQVLRSSSSRDHLLAFRGDRQQSRTVQCRTIPLALSFEWKYNKVVGKRAWVVNLSQL